MFTTTVLSTLRTMMATVVQGSCTVASVSDSSGAQTWGTPASCDCIVANSGKGNATEQMEYTGGEPGATIFLPVSVSIKAGDRIVDSRNSKNYKVAHVPSIHTDELLRPVICVEVRTAGANA